MIRSPYVYILSSGPHGTLYIGVTSKLLKRVWEHKTDATDGFTKKYGVHDLVWHEAHGNMESAISQEKKIKKWSRKWKIEMIELTNPTWKDLYDDLAKNS